MDEPRRNLQVLDETGLATIKVEPGSPTRMLPLREGAAIKTRFRTAFVGAVLIT